VHDYTSARAAPLVLAPKTNYKAASLRLA
jgi:hypothetical protein